MSRTTSGSAAGSAARIEAHGIDHIPEQERRGQARRLFSVWAAANVNYLSLVVGAALVLMGLGLWQSIAVIVVGNLFWLFPGSSPSRARPRAHRAR